MNGNYYRPRMRTDNIFVVSLCVCLSVCVCVSVRAVTFEAVVDDYLI